MKTMVDILAEHASHTHVMVHDGGYLNHCSLVERLGLAYVLGSKLLELLIEFCELLAK